MKVTGPGGPSQTTASRTTRAAGGEGFRVAAPQAPAAPAATAGVSSANAVMGVEALIALQDVGSPLERRRRSVGRANRILDVLDSLKISLLGGELGGEQLDQLVRAVRQERAATDDPKLEGLLDEIETRAAVELAKRESARAA